MKLRNSTIIYALLAFVLAGGCKKTEYPSRDTSGLHPDPPVVIDPDDAKPFVLFDSCDKLDGLWDVALGTGSLETQGKKEGTGYIKSRITPGQDFMQYQRRNVSPVDTKVTPENGQFMFWFYIQDASQLKEGQIQISSANDPDKFRYGWDIMKVGPLVNGWNRLKLNISDAYSSDGGANLAAMNYFRVFFNTKEKVSADFVTGIDGLKFVQK
ncbi:hypothetical protein [Pedobacter sp.]|jgi:hypothetical protein|uniref:hypothetical protein n=1 Tax=Pedobacter sp. TaxID=1411316 RepID=UPI002BB8013F|nr:hypothetical protein [Pedobacter sp.]HWW41433.1 hypothetical protein [Pedobacter sp.]